MAIARATAALAAAALGCAGAGAADEPLWEAGLGVATVYFPDYRGADHSRAYALPAPYLVYRGDFFKADRKGMRGVFYKEDRLDLNMSVGASLPVDSTDNPVRAGMPDLRASIELGPSLDVTLWRSGDRRTTLEARFPTRFAVTIESHPRFIGAQFFPHLNVDIADALGFAGWNLGMLAGPVVTDGRNNRYYYEVPAEFATPTRPQYRPGGGYGGAQFIVALSKRFPSFWVGGFARADTLNGASFESSPLVTSKRYVAGGVAVAWIIGESRERVPVLDLGKVAR